MTKTQWEKRQRLMSNLANLGFTNEESEALRRIEMALSRWAEHECNGDIQRDEKTGVAYWHYGRGTNGPFRTARIADREAGALKRLGKIVDARNKRDKATAEVNNHDPVRFYHQGDPRGCSLYIVRVRLIGDEDIRQLYTRGLAVCD